MGKICLLECLKPSACKIGLIFLHTELTNEEVAYHRRKFEILWRNSVFTCAADSGGNFLYDHFCKTSDGKVLENPWLPDLISGDFDSLHKAALDFFQTFPNVRVEHTPDQDETDFTKALRLVVEEIRKKDLKVSMIVAVCSGKGRFDHNMGNINTLFKANFICDIPVILMSERDLQYVIPSGCRHELLLDTGLEGPHCGLIPVHGASTVTTSGLRWNLDRQKMEFGGLISTSNEVASVSVSVESDLPILWTMSVKEPDASTE